MKGFLHSLSLGLLLYFLGGFQSLSAFECPDLESIDRKFRASFYKDVVWSESAFEGVAKTYARRLDPFEILNWPEFESEIFSDALYEKNCEEVSKLFLAVQSELAEKKQEWLADTELYRFQESSGDKEPEKTKTDSKEGFSFEAVYSFLAQRLFETVADAKEYYSNEDVHEYLVRSVVELLFPLLSEAEAISDRWAFETALVDSYFSSQHRFSGYIAKEKVDSLMKSLSSGFIGFGVSFFSTPDGIVVHSLIENAEAAREKILEPGDVIHSINNISIDGMSTHSVKQLLESVEEKSVQVSIRRPGSVPASMVFEISKGPLKIATSCHDKNAPLITCVVPVFYGANADVRLPAVTLDLRNKIISVIKESDQKLKGLILDLRGNLGGQLSEAAAMSQFLTYGYEEGFQPPMVFQDVRGIFGKLGVKITYARSVEFSNHQILHPLAILVDSKSASASEIVAGNVYAAGAGLVISDGDSKTYGKGSVQEYSTLSNGGVLKVTTGYYYTMDGRSPERVGVFPHIILPRKEKSLEPEDDQSAEPQRIENRLAYDNSSFAFDRLAMIENEIQAAKASVQLEQTEESFMSAVRDLLQVY